MQPRNSRVYSLTLSVVCIYMDSKTAYKFCVQVKTMTLRGAQFQNLKFSFSSLPRTQYYVCQTIENFHLNSTNYRHEVACLYSTELTLRYKTF
jgi:hypothetical protein